MSRSSIGDVIRLTYRPFLLINRIKRIRELFDHNDGTFISEFGIYTCKILLELILKESQCSCAVYLGEILMELGTWRKNKW